MPVDPNKISLISIKTLKGHIATENDFSTPTQLYHFSFELKTQSNLDRKLIRLILDSKIQNVDLENNPTSIAASYTTEFVFQIENMSELVVFDEEINGLKLDYNLGVTLTSIAYSTLRGILNIRTQGTILNGIILPIIDPGELITKSIPMQVAGV